MVRPRANQTECRGCHRFIPAMTKGGLCPECEERAKYVLCDNCHKRIRLGEEFNHGPLRCCSLSCKRELQKTCGYSIGWQALAVW